jgi:hypothetical protein
MVEKERDLVKGKEGKGQRKKDTGTRIRIEINTKCSKEEVEKY